MPTLEGGTNAAPSPCSGAGRSTVRVQLMTLGLNVAPVIRLNEIGDVAPVAVCTVMPEVLGTPFGTEVTIYESVQSLIESAIVAWIGVPPLPVKNTFPCFASPKALPSISTVMPTRPVGFVTPLTLVMIGATAWNAASSVSAPPSRLTTRTRSEEHTSELQ